MSQGRNRVSVVFVFAVIFFLIHKIIPIIGYNTPAVVNIAVLCFLYSYILLNGGFKIIINSGVLLMFGVFFLSVLYCKYSNLTLYIYGILQIVIYPLITIFIVKKGSFRQIQYITLSVWLAYMITAFTTIIGCHYFPEAPREIAAALSSEDAARYHLYMNMNIGSLSYIYTLVLMLPILVYIIRFKAINRIISICCLFLFVTAIYSSQYATALLFMFVGISPFVLHKRFKANTILSIIILCVILFFFFKDFIANIFVYFSSTVQSEILADRFQSFADFLLGGQNGSDGDVAARQYFYKSSFDAFLKSPIWGSFNVTGGGHSYVLDVMANYGLIGLGALVVMYRKIYTLFYSTWRRSDIYGYIYMTFIMSICLAILNPKELFIVHTIIVPLSVQYLYIKMNHNESLVGRK